MMICVQKEVQLVHLSGYRRPVITVAALQVLVASFIADHYR